MESRTNHGRTEGGGGVRGVPQGRSQDLSEGGSNLCCRLTSPASKKLPGQMARPFRGLWGHAPPGNYELLCVYWCILRSFSIHLVSYNRKMIFFYNLFLLIGWLPISEIKHAYLKNQKIKLYIQASSYVILSSSIFSTRPLILIRFFFIKNR